MRRVLITKVKAVRPAFATDEFERTIAVAAAAKNSSRVKFFIAGNGRTSDADARRLDNFLIDAERMFPGPEKPPANYPTLSAAAQTVLATEANVEAAQVVFTSLQDTYKKRGERRIDFRGFVGCTPGLVSIGSACVDPSIAQFVSCLGSVETVRVSAHGTDDVAVSIPGASDSSTWVIEGDAQSSAPTIWKRSGAIEACAKFVGRPTKQDIAAPVDPAPIATSCTQYCKRVSDPSVSCERRQDVCRRWVVLDCGKRSCGAEKAAFCDREFAECMSKRVPPSPSCDCKAPK
jgi:hypothetical protein